MRRKILANNAEEDSSLIDLTPMLDVVFIMLIFFIVTTSFVKEAGIDVNRPESTQAETKENASIIVAVNDTNEIWIDNRRVDVRACKAHLARLLANSPSGVVIIQADALSNARTYTAVYDAAKAAGAEQIALSVSEA